MAKGFSPYKGQLKSLGGVLGRLDSGYQVERPDALINTTGIELLHQNPLRLWALIQNQGAGDCTISFDTGTGVATTFLLHKDDIIQIDALLPWAGAVYVAAAVAVNIDYQEASIIE